MKKPKWAKPLTAKDLKHLKEQSATGRPTLRGLKLNLEAQAKSGVHCWECRSMGHRLGLTMGDVKL